MEISQDQLANDIELAAATGSFHPSLSHWKKDAEAAGLLFGRVQNDHI
jgi:hypothetical protein